VKIGIVDSGINPNLAEFAGRIDPASGDVAGNRGVSDEDGHGTAVSAVAAAARNGQGTMGVAFNATIVNLRADDPGSCASKDGCEFFDDAIAAGIDAARMAGAKVINMSLGGSVPSGELMDAMARAVNAGIVLVISAGNDGDTAEGKNPDPFALTPAKAFPGMVIIAGSVGVSGGRNVIDVSEISDFSNKAGSGAEYYLMALGYRDEAPGNDGQSYLWSGTSFSAPTITGAVALLAQAFPNLTGKQIVDILFNSADDLGDPGVDSIYGHGRLNIAQAFQPIGKTSLANSEQAVSTTMNGDAPAAAGDAPSQGSMGAIILDGYDRAFVLNLAKTLKQARPDMPLSRSLNNDMRSVSTTAGPLSIALTVSENRERLAGFAVENSAIGPQEAAKARLVAGSVIAKIDDETAVAFGFSEGAKAMQRRLQQVSNGGFLVARDVAGDPGFTAKRDGSIAMRRKVGTFGVTLAAESGDVWNDVRTSATGSPYSLASVAVDRKVGPVSLGLGISRLVERQTLLGGRMGDVLGGGGSSSLFVDAEARSEFGSGWSAGLTARRGWTGFNGGRFQSGAYGFDLSKAGLFGARDRFGLRIAQPLRIESGGFGMLLPVGYDYATQSVTMGYSTLSLAPKGREVDGEISYGTWMLGDKAWFGGNIFYRRDPGHISNSKDDVGAALRFSLNF